MAFGDMPRHVPTKEFITLHVQMLALRIALRYFFSRKTHNAVNVISIISVAGVAVATMAIMCVLSVFNGFYDMVFSHVSLVVPELTVEPVGGKVIEDADSVTAAVKRVEGVAAAAPVIDEAALAVYRQYHLPVSIYGVPASYDSIVDYSRVIIDGEVTARQMSASGAGLLSVGAANGLMAFPGTYDPVHLYVPRRKGRINPAMPSTAFRTDSVAVTAVYQAEDKDADMPRIVMSLAQAREMLDYVTEGSRVDISVTPGEDISAVRDSISASLGPSYRVLDRYMQQAEAFRMVNVEKWITFLLLAFILVIASFNIISTLSMLIIEKEGSMGVLRAMGAPRRMIADIFTIEGALITLFGGIAGIVLGVILSLVQQTTGIIKMGGDHTKMIISSYPVRLEWGDALAVLGLIVAVSLLTSLVARFMVPRRITS